MDVFTSRNKWLLPLKVVLAFVLLIWLVWYMSTYLRRRREAVLVTASVALSCPPFEIHIGPSHQEGDGPTELQAYGCGKNATILCDDYGSRRGFIKQYFAFDVVCRESK